jgi:hypothetical protein
MSSRHLAGYLWLIVALVVASIPAIADPHVQTYTMTGSDAFRIASRQLQSLITYRGNETLSVQSAADAVNYHAIATYEKSDGAATTHAHAAYALTMSPAGDVSNQQDADPDYLTILNQPFSVQLDGPTMRDLHALTQPVPFDFPSPMTGAPLHGSLRRLLDGTLGGVRVLGIAFSASGPLAGTLPDRPTLALSGHIRMNGTAYYAYANALLLALDATLLIEGKVDGAAGNDAVTITYKRSIRPLGAEIRGR